jgi:hypothetical protein
VREIFQVEVPLRQLFESPTLGDLAVIIEDARQQVCRLSLPAIVPVPRDQPLPLSFSQQRLWFMSQMAYDSALYIIPSSLCLTGELNLVALEQSFNEIVRRHEVLRTRFNTVDGALVQLIDPNLFLTMHVADLRELSPSERENESERLGLEKFQRPFDLRRGPFLRLSLLRLRSDEHVLLLTAHHIVTDGWSISLLTGELEQLYAAYLCGNPSPLAELPIQYADYAYRQRQWLQGEVLEVQLDYWKRQLAKAPKVLDLTRGRPRPEVRSFVSDKQSFVLSPALSRKLALFSREQGVTLFMTLLAAYQTLLHLHTGQDIISVGSPIANRNRAETERLIGYFVNILVLCTDLSGSPSFRELLARVREMTLTAYTHQDLPFEQIVEILQPERSLSYAPLVQVTFTFQNAPAQPLRLSQLSLSPVVKAEEPVEYDLSLLMASDAGDLVGSLIYNTELFDAASVSRLIDHFKYILEHVVEYPDMPLLEIPLPGIERAKTVEAALQLQLNDQGEQFDYQL